MHFWGLAAQMASAGVSLLSFTLWATPWILLGREHCPLTLPNRTQIPMSQHRGCWGCTKELEKMELGM